MAQKTVELIIGRILTDEGLRARFVERPAETLVSLRDQGHDLTNGEIAALVQTDMRLWQRGTKWLDVGLQRCRLTDASTSELND
jgi:hypothetical protein